MPVGLEGLLEVRVLFQATAHIIGDKQKLVQVYQSILDKFKLIGSMEGGITS